MKFWHKDYQFWWIVGFALAIRLILLALGIQDYWGDAYHNILIEHNFADSNFLTYFDYKDRHLVWLPLFRILSAVFIKLTGIHSVQGLHFFSFLLFILQIYPVSKLYQLKSADFSSLKVAILFLLPIPILFSTYHLSEMLSFTICVYLTWFIVSKNKSGIVIVSFLMVLTRHEATFLLGLITIVLFLRSDSRKLSYWIVLGSFAGLAIWSAWIFTQTGDALSWLFKRVAASSSGASSFRIKTGWGFRFVEILFSIVVTFPLFGYLKRAFSWHYAGIIYLVSFLIAGNFLFHSADAKYMLVAVPVLVFGLDSVKILNQKKAVLGILILVNVIALPVFWIRSYNLEAERQVGYYLKTLPSTIVWNDHPVSIYTSDFKHKSISSSQLTNQMEKSDLDLTALVQKDSIKYVVYYKSDRSLLESALPESPDINTQVDFYGVRLKCIYNTSFDEMYKQSSWFMRPFLDLFFQDANQASMYQVFSDAEN